MCEPVSYGPSDTPVIPSGSCVSQLQARAGIELSIPE
jgi:hypothetical protein